MESPFAQRMERLWMSLLMMVASSSALRRSLLPPNGSSMEADWSSRKMKHPGFFRLISALYILAPRFRLLGASFDRVRLELLDLARLDRRAFHRRRLDPGRVDLHVRDRNLALVARDRLRASHRGRRGRDAGLAERPMPHEPRDRSGEDERDPRVEQLGRSADLRSPASRARRARPALGKPGQTTCVALPEARGQHSDRLDSH